VWGRSAPEGKRARGGSGQGVGEEQRVRQRGRKGEKNGKGWAGVKVWGKAACEALIGGSSEVGGGGAPAEAMAGSSI
jgi:hypothetical protein